MTGHHRTVSSNPCFCPVTANLSSNWAGPLPRQPPFPHREFSKSGGARAPHAQPGAQTDRHSVSVRDKPERGALRRNFRHGDLRALGQGGGKPPWGCERALRGYEDRGQAAGASALSWGGWREQTGPGRGAGGAAGARWGDEVLTELSPVEGQRTNERTGQQRMPGVREGLPRRGHFSRDSRSRRSHRAEWGQRPRHWAKGTEACVLGTPVQRQQSRGPKSCEGV